MKLTSKIALVSVALTATAANMAMADAIAFSDIDTDASGVLEVAELEAIFGDQAVTALRLYDANGNGAIDADEAEEISLETAADASETGDAEATVTQ